MSENQASKPAGLFRHRDFMKLWIAQTLSVAGSEVTNVALPLAAVVLLNASVFEVGLLVAAGYCPFLFIALPAGVVIDRLPKRPILILSDVGRAVTLGAVPLLYAFGLLNLPMLYPIVFINGVFTVMFAVAHQSYLPALVERSQLVEGNTKLQTTEAVAQLAGPGIGGVLVELLKAPFAIGLDALSFVGSALSLSLIRRKEPPIRAAEIERLPLLQSIREGMRFVFRERHLRPIVSCTALANFFDIMGIVKPILPILAIQQLGLSPLEFGLVFAFGNLGALLGALMNGRMVSAMGIGRAITLSSFLPGMAVLLMPLASSNQGVYVLSLAMAVAGFGAAVFNINQVSLRQSITPGAMQGRMNATIRFVIWGTIPLGALAGGALAETIGLQATLVIGGLGSLAATFFIVFSPVRTLRKIPTPPEAQDAWVEALEPISEEPAA